MAILSACISVVAILTSTAAAALPPVAPKSGCFYNVDGVGQFNTHLSADFGARRRLPDFLVVSTDTVGDGHDPYSRTFSPKNVLIKDGALSLYVDPTKNTSIPSAEVATTGAYLYGSVRTVAKASSPGGTCNGIFFYRDDNHEIDIEIRTHHKKQIWYTNQSLKVGQQPTDKAVKQKFNLSDGYHEYRIDWVRNSTKFYFDGQLQATFTTNVPQLPANFVWNNWASGGEWTGRLPTEIGALEIRSIDAYLNNTELQCAY